MPPPSQLTIAASSVQRLIKEEASYHQELAKQRARVQQLQANPDGDENAEYQLKQENRAIEETLAVFPPLRQRLADAVHRLEDQLEAAETQAAPAEEVVRAREVLARAREAVAGEGEGGA